MKEMPKTNPAVNTLLEYEGAVMRLKPLLQNFANHSVAEQAVLAGVFARVCQGDGNKEAKFIQVAKSCAQAGDFRPLVVEFDSDVTHDNGATQGTLSAEFADQPIPMTQLGWCFVGVSPVYVQAAQQWAEGASTNLMGAIDFIEGTDNLGVLFVEDDDAIANDIETIATEESEAVLSIFDDELEEPNEDEEEDDDDEW